VDASIETRVREVLYAYGKLALLIEDAPDARLRTARELYAADGLPLWWLHFDNIEEAAEALKTACAAVLDGQPSWARDKPLLAVVDRYLRVGSSATQKEKPAAARSAAWDGGESNEPVTPAAEQMAESIARLLGAAATLPVHVALVSSYSGSSRAAVRADSRREDWQRRSDEPIYRLRRHLRKGLRDLLEFGPTPTAPIRQPEIQSVIADPNEAKAAACRALHWKSAIDDLAAALVGHDPDVAFILMTGAGASLASEPLAPGIPPTWYLLDLACWLTENNEARPKPPWPPSDSPRGGARGPEVESLDKLCRLVAGGSSARDLVWSLETLFQPRDNDPKDFFAAFRQALQVWDHDFPYHAWLLAQLPWTLILTTNFDSFHERAAAGAAAAASIRSPQLMRRLGELLPIPNPGAAPDVRKVMEGPGLLKPYGTLMTQGPLALQASDFWQHIRSVNDQYLNPILGSCRECRLVIVGHRLAADFRWMLDALDQSDQRNSPKLRILWVEPAPHLCTLDSEATSRLKALLDKPASADPKRAQLLPARALDFAFDLWQVYRYRQRANQAS
jgi:hypothetical protein